MSSSAQGCVCDIRLEYDQSLDSMRQAEQGDLGRSSVAIRNHTDITESMIAEWLDLREAIRHEEGRGGQCGFVCEVIAKRCGVHVSGVYLSVDGEPLGGDHDWVVLRDGTIIDMTADQFGETDYRIVPPGDPLQTRYREPAWSEFYNPGMVDEFPELKGVKWSGEYDHLLAARLRRERGPGWWLQDRTMLDAYEAKEKGYGHRAPGARL